MAEDISFVYRGDLIESIHQGDIAVVNDQGQVLYNLGDSEKITYWRSAAKPVQVLPVISSGAADEYDLTDKEIAVMCASHSGEKEHVETVSGILDKLGLDHSYLQCGTHPPKNKKAAQNLWRKDKEPTTLHNNCSGKHAGLLTLCRYYNWDLSDYYNPDHPLQKMLLDTISEIADYPRDKIYTGEDGCGVVVYGLPLSNMAYAFARLANPSSLPPKYREAAERVVKSMENYPLQVGGSERFNTRLMEVTKGKLVAKSGAQGVFCFGLNDKKLGFALKVTDGSSRGIKPAVIESLKQLDVLTSDEEKKLAEYSQPPVLNHREHKVGYITSDFKLEEVK